MPGHLSKPPHSLPLRGVLRDVGPGLVRLPCPGSLGRTRTPADSWDTNGRRKLLGLGSGLYVQSSGSVGVPANGVVIIVNDSTRICLRWCAC